MLVIGIFIYSNNLNSNKNLYQANRTSTTHNQTTNSNTLDDNNVEQQNNNNAKKIEEQISTFSTKIYDHDSARQNNISLTCSRLNGTVVAKGETFSFTNTLGPSNQSKGYQKADILDNKGHKLKEYGGGNCQISSTLYNAVLAVPNLVVTERHEHSNYVPYIQKGKDAAVAYGSYDLKFRNDSENDIKILTSTDGATVTATLVSIK